MVRVETAEAAADWWSALHWQRICHKEQVAITESHHQIQLASFQERLVTTIDVEQRRWLQDALQSAQSEVHTLANRLLDQRSTQAAAAPATPSSTHRPAAPSRFILTRRETRCVWRSWTQIPGSRRPIWSGCSSIPSASLQFQRMARRGAARTGAGERPTAGDGHGRTGLR